MSPLEYLKRNCLQLLRGAGFSDAQSEDITDFCIAEFKRGRFHNANDVFKFINSTIKKRKSKENRAAFDPLKRRR